MSGDAIRALWKQLVDAHDVPVPVGSKVDFPDFGSVFTEKKFIEIVSNALAASEAAALRQMDLIRYARHFLHNENLISDEEYAAIVQDNEGGKRVARLEGYDAALEKVIQSAKRDGRRETLKEINDYADILHDPYNLYGLIQDKLKEALDPEVP